MTLAERSALMLCACLLTATVSASGITPHQLLDRMNEAVRALDYEGRFVVQSGERLDAMHIVHRMSEGTEKERVVSLTGKTREIIRSNEAVACLVSGSDQHINVERRARGRSFSPLRGISADQLAQSYRIELLEPGRVAGRDAHQILIEPRDELRYGYRLFIDQDSALPLRSLMLDEARQPISQMMFVDLHVGQAVAPIEQPASASQPARARPVDDVGSLLQQRLAPPAWEFSELPAGFLLNGHRRRAAAHVEGNLEHFIFSDGLATVSVYVQPTSGEGTLSGPSRLGAARAVGEVVDDHEVIVVGEVPLKTLQFFAANIRSVKP